MTASADRIVDDLTVIILTKDEEANLGRTLDALAWAKAILIVDSGSTDATLTIAAQYPQVRTVHRAFDSFAEQCNFALGEATSRWILSLDADYEVSPELGRELEALVDDGMAGWFVKFVYRVHGRPLHGSLYPPRRVLYRRDLSRYRNEGHGHRVTVDGPVGRLRGVIYHDDRKPLSRWLGSQVRYAQVEAEHLLASPRRELSLPDRIRLMCWPAPALVLFHVLFVRGCIRDGRAGWLYAMQRVLSEVTLLIALLDRRLRRNPPC